jgi:uncharacterized protein (UPF0333 family)
MFKDLIKLLALLILLAFVITGIYFAGQSVDNTAKYRHPITQPGARW